MYAIATTDKPNAKAIVNTAATDVAPPFNTAAPHPIKTSTIVPTISAINFVFIIYFFYSYKIYYSL